MKRNYVSPTLIYVLITTILSSIMVSFLQANESDAFFDDSYVHEIRLTFDETEYPDWYTTLYDSHANDSEDPYFPVSFSCDGITLDKIGIRMKGNASFEIDSIKKSLKLDFNEYDEDIEGAEETTFMGLKKLNLNNGYNDPSFLREKIFLDFASQYIPTIRCVHTRVYINDEYIGLYIAVDQVDKTFIEDNFGNSEDGNLYKGAASDDLADDPMADFGSDLTWIDSNESSYYDHYQLKTNEEENDYSGLVNMIDILNNSDPDDFPELLEPVMDVDNVLAGLALNTLFSNFDSYNGSAHNYYIYQSDITGQFSHILWDANESFGTFNLYNNGEDMTEIDPFWVPTGENRPLMTQLWQNDSYAKKYLSYLARMLNEGFDESTMSNRIEELADLIREDVYADNNKQYSNDAFEQNLYSDYSTEFGPRSKTIYGLTSFISARATYMKEALDSYADTSDLRINEIVLKDEDYTDESGEADSWIEIYNAGVGSVSLSGLYLSESESTPTQWSLPDVSIESGDFVIIWVDGESSDGTTHASFALSENGGSIYLYDSESNLIDSVDYPMLSDNYSYQRYPDGDDTFVYSDRNTPGASNLNSETPSVVIYINEIMAENDETIQDPDGTGYPDWFELYNPNDESVNLGGMYLTDDTDNPKQFQIPDDVEIEAKGFLIIWADNDEGQGSTHANFKLSSNGEELALYDTDENGNVLIDLVEFGAQTSDISYGRNPDGSDTFEFFSTPTPGSSNTKEETFWNYSIQNIDGNEWINTDSWMGWLQVSYRPWAWSVNLTNWLYMNENFGGWIWAMADPSSPGTASGEGSYLGYPIENSNGEAWIDTGNWLGRLKVSDAPWVYSEDNNGWMYMNENYKNDAGAWIWIYY